MCGRFTLATPPELVADLFNTQDLPLFDNRFNIAPTQPMLAVVAEDHERKYREFRWGLVPSWSKDSKGAARLINARSETAASKPSFRAAMKKRRCLVPADGFYEWKAIGKTRQPFYIQRTDTPVFAFAGLWESWKSPDGESLKTCSLLTTEANSLMATLHDRMPVMVESKQFDRWLDVDRFKPEDLTDIFRPFDPDRMTLRAVSTYVNNARHEGEQCLDEPMEQGELF